MKKHEQLALYIVEHMRVRNGGELCEAFDNMRVRDRALLIEELTMILEHGGRPPNWIK